MGPMSDHDDVKCSACAGTGKIKDVPKVNGVPLQPGLRPMCGGTGAADPLATVRCGFCGGHGCVKEQATAAPAETKALPFGPPDVSADGLQDLERAAAVLLALGFRNYCAGELARSDSCRELAASLQRVVSWERGARLRSEPNPPDVTFGPR